MKISVIGTGYVGLVSGVCLSETGNDVTCVDNNIEKVKKLQEGIIPIYESGLDILFERNVKQNRLHFSTDLKSAVENTDIIMLALPTPPGEDGSADLKYIIGVSNDIGKFINGYKVVINKSTVPVGTAEKVRNEIAKHTTIEFDVVSNPEFLKEGKAIEDFMKPDRVVIGTKSEKARQIMGRMYEPFVRQGNPIYYMDERSSELTKYAANSYLATRISFMNEMANLCELVGADVDMVRVGMGSDNRIGKRFLFPGVGYGGSCFPKDVMALAKTADQTKYDFKILKSVMSVNDRQRLVLYEKVKEFFKGDLKGKKIAVWGIAFKPETDDIREAPALYIIENLFQDGALITAYDPEATENARHYFGDKVTMVEDMYDALEGADALLIITEWSVFRTPDFERMIGAMKTPVVFDGRNVYHPQDMFELGFYYNSIGRKIIEK